jgi:integration host factor subunit alpha
MSEKDAPNETLEEHVAKAIAPGRRSCLTKDALAARLVHQLGVTKREAEGLIEGFFTQIGVALATGRHVKLARFGQFFVRAKAARPGRNPKTGEPMVITPRRVVVFRSSPILVRQVNTRARQ